MSEQKEEFYLYMHTLLNLDLTEQNDDLLKLFSTFISSNRDFKYNHSYLLDSIPDFWEHVDTFQKKRTFCQELAKAWQKKYTSLNDWVVFVDNAFVIDSSFHTSLIIDSCSVSESQQQNAYKILETFNLFSLDRDIVQLIFFNHETKASFAISCSPKNTIPVFDLVAKTLEHKKKEDK